jgi:hypothetical protein
MFHTEAEWLYTLLSKLFEKVGLVDSYGRHFYSGGWKARNRAERSIGISNLGVSESGDRSSIKSIHFDHFWELTHIATDMWLGPICGACQWRKSCGSTGRHQPLSWSSRHTLIIPSIITTTTGAWPCCLLSICLPQLSSLPPRRLQLLSPTLLLPIVLSSLWSYPPALLLLPLPSSPPASPSRCAAFFVISWPCSPSTSQLLKFQFDQLSLHRAAKLLEFDLFNVLFHHPCSSLPCIHPARRNGRGSSWTRIKSMNCTLLRS